MYKSLLGSEPMPDGDLLVLKLFLNAGSANGIFKYSVTAVQFQSSP